MSYMVEGSEEESKVRSCISIVCAGGVERGGYGSLSWRNSFGASESFKDVTADQREILVVGYAG